MNFGPNRLNGHIGSRLAVSAAEMFTPEVGYAIPQVRFHDSRRTRLRLPKQRSMLAIAITAACLATSLRAQFVYVANEGSDNVSGFSFGPTGELTAIGAPVAAGHFPNSVAVDP